MDNSAGLGKKKKDHTYTELLQVVKGEGIVEEVQKSIVQHASVSVTVRYNVSASNQVQR